MEKILEAKDCFSTKNIKIRRFITSPIQPPIKSRDILGFRTAAAGGPNSETLTTSNEESLNTNVVDLFELYNLESEFALFGLR